MQQNREWFVFPATDTMWYLNPPSFHETKLVPFKPSAGLSQFHYISSCQLQISRQNFLQSQGWKARSSNVTANTVKCRRKKSPFAFARWKKGLKSYLEQKSAR